MEAHATAMEILRCNFGLLEKQLIGGLEIQLKKQINEFGAFDPFPRSRWKDLDN